VAYTNAQISQHLSDIATAYEIKHKSRFRITAYENAADTILTYPENLYQLWQKNPQLLDDVPNIGPSILKKINYFFVHHQPYPALKNVFKDIHPAVFTFIKINGIGPLIAHKITSHLKFPKDPLKALDKLVLYCRQDKIATIPAFGQKSQSSILDNTLSFIGRRQRMSLHIAQKLAAKVIDYLHCKFPDTEFIPLGSLRRQSATVGDIDLAAASINPTPILAHFIEYPDAVETISVGKAKASIRLKHDIHIDLMIKPPASFGALLQHFTGSAQHNILLRKHALKLGYRLSEYGIKDLKTGKIHRFNNETSFYNFLHLKLIPAQKRIGTDELTKYQMI